MQISPILTTRRNGNQGIVPPWLQHGLERLDAGLARLQPPQAPTASAYKGVLARTHRPLADTLMLPR